MIHLAIYINWITYFTLGLCYDVIWQKYKRIAKTYYIVFEWTLLQIKKKKAIYRLDKEIKLIIEELDVIWLSAKESKYECSAIQTSRTFDRTALERHLYRVKKLKRKWEQK